MPSMLTGELLSLVIQSLLQVVLSSHFPCEKPIASWVREKKPGRKHRSNWGLLEAFIEREGEVFLVFKQVWVGGLGF